MERPFIHPSMYKRAGMDVTKGVTPDQEFIKIMYDELVSVMGAEQAELAQVCIHMVKNLVIDSRKLGFQALPSLSPTHHGTAVHRPTSPRR